MGKPHVTIRILPSLLMQLNRHVEKTGTSRTDVIVSALAQYLGTVEDVPLTQRVAELEVKVKEIELLLKC